MITITFSSFSIFLQGTSVLSPCIPIAIVIGAAIIIFKKSTTNLVQNNPCLYLLTFGIIIAKITNKLVVSSDA